MSQYNATNYQSESRHNWCRLKKAIPACHRGEPQQKRKCFVGICVSDWLSSPQRRRPHAGVFPFSGRERMEPGTAMLSFPVE